VSEGRRVLVTGASQGIGAAIADAFAAGGADVAICARSGDALQAAAAGLRARHPNVRVHAQTADVAREADVDALIDGTVAALGGLDVLVANAGVYGPKGAIEHVDWEAWVDAIRINLLGVVYCTRRALPALRRSARGKIVILSGGGATKPLPYLSAYAASKAAVVRYGETLAEELRADGIDVNMVAPGALNTRLLDEVLAAGPQVVGEAFYASSLKQRDGGGTPLEVGAALCVYLASREADGITGKLISAPWDPWQRFGAGKSRLDGDVYTLRRIVPEERGWSW
jgi:NAD(P)-dependent dehydrogenase (short-subunit alcohol dehydrogenase family)